MAIEPRWANDPPGNTKLNATRLNSYTPIRGDFTNPNGNVIGSPGDTYLNTIGGTGQTLWVKETGSGTNTGWVVPGGGGTAPDATTSTKGIIQLAGHLAGTATAPTVPGLAIKADLVSGKVPTNELGAGTASSTTFLRGDQTWATPAGGAGPHVIEDSNLNTFTPRPNLFFDSGFLVTDNTGLQATVITPTTYRTVADEGVVLNPQSVINFKGAGVTAADNPGTSRTDVTIPGGVTQSFTVKATNPDGNQLYLSGLNDSPMDGVVLQNGDLVYYHHTNVPGDDGIYVVNTTGNWTRYTGMALGMTFVSGLLIQVQQGFLKGGHTFVVREHFGAASWVVTGYPSGPILDLYDLQADGPYRLSLPPNYSASGSSDFFRISTNGFSKIVLTTDSIVAFIDPPDDYGREFRLVVEQDSVGGHVVLWSPATIAWEDGIEPKVNPAPGSVTYIRGEWLGLNYGLSARVIPQQQHLRRLPPVYNGFTFGIIVEVMRGTSETSIQNAIAILNRWTTQAHRNVLGANGVKLQYSDGFSTDTPLVNNLRGYWEYYGGFTATGGSAIRGNPVPYTDGTVHEYYHAEHNYYFPNGFVDPGGGVYTPYAGLNFTLLNHPVVRSCWYRAYHAVTSRTLTCSIINGSAVVTTTGTFTNSDISGTICLAGISGAGIPTPTRVVSGCTTNNGFGTVQVPSGTFTNADLGSGISGTGIPAGSAVISVDSATQISINNLASASGTVALTVTNQTRIVSVQSGTQLTMSANATATNGSVTLTILSPSGNQSALAEWWAQMRATKKIVAAGDGAVAGGTELSTAGNVAQVVTDFENFITHTGITGG